MTVPNLDTGDFIDDAWVDAVADQLNNLPLKIAHGLWNGTTTAGGDASISFGTTFDTVGLTILAFVRVASSQQYSCHMPSVPTGAGCTVRVTSNDAPAASVTVSLYWVALGSAP